MYAEAFVQLRDTMAAQCDDDGGDDYHDDDGIYYTLAELFFLLTLVALAGPYACGVYLIIERSGSGVYIRTLD